MKVDIGIFAYNEETNISQIIRQIAKQSILINGKTDIQVVILANGCIDKTVINAEETIKKLPSPLSEKFLVQNLTFKGKSKTWNHFVHSMSRNDCETIFFMDADISLQSPSTFEDMNLKLLNTKSICAVSSFAVKDLKITKRKLTPVEKLISSGGATAESYAHSICGQLYAVKRTALSNIYMPAGLPVEDGFLRAIILTDNFSQPESFEKISTTNDIWHTYESIRSISELINHQTRIIIGSAINTEVFSKLSSLQNRNDRITLLKLSSTEESWLKNLLKKNLPKRPYGYIPFHFLTKRIAHSNHAKLHNKIKLALGLTFDAVVYINARQKMARGKGAGHW